MFACVGVSAGHDGYGKVRGYSCRSAFMFVHYSNNWAFSGSLGKSTPIFYTLKFNSEKMIVSPEKNNFTEAL